MGRSWSCDNLTTIEKSEAGFPILSKGIHLKEGCKGKFLSESTNKDGTSNEHCPSCGAWFTRKMESANNSKASERAMIIEDESDSLSRNAVATGNDA